MYQKYLIRITFLASLLAVVVILFNFIVDPKAYNNLFKYEFNHEKIRREVGGRRIKYEMMHQPGYNTYIFGNSRSMAIDPEYVDSFLVPGDRTLNLAFSAAMNDEIALYLNYLTDQNKDISMVFVSVDFSSFTFDFQENRILPYELSGDLELSRYFSLDLLYQSFVVIYQSLFPSLQKVQKEDLFFVKGMKKYEGYLYARKNGTLDDYIQTNVVEKQPFWLGNHFSEEKFKAFHQSIKKLRRNNISFYLYTHPLIYRQLLYGDRFLDHLQFIQHLVSTMKVDLYDFNNFNQVNFDDHRYVDIVHFNYDVGECLIERILTGQSACGADFGYLVNEDNVEEYVQFLEKKWFELKHQYDQE